MRIRVLSPHRDDAVFSCGLLLLDLLRVGVQVTICNVCTRSEYAPYLPEDASPRWQQVSREREAEDDRAFALLRLLTGAAENAIDTVDLAWQDAPLRLGLQTACVLQTGPLPEEIAELGQVFAALPAADLVLAPMALGSHVDHLSVRAAASAHLPRARLLFYEDQPYVCRMAAGERTDALKNFSGTASQAHRSAVAGVKRDLSMVYASQIDASVAEEMERHGVERFHGEPEAIAVLAAALRPAEGAAAE